MPRFRVAPRRVLLGMFNDETTPDTSTAESFADAQADRAPTPAEESAAEKAALDVDVAEVAKHYEEMIELGANVVGEGQIEPS